MVPRKNAVGDVTLNSLPCISMKWIKIKGEIWQSKWEKVNETQVLSVISDRCPVAEQRRSGRHQATLKRKCADEFNFAVMECYFFCNPVVEIISGMKKVCLSWVNKIFLIKQEPLGKINGFQHLRLRWLRGEC